MYKSSLITASGRGIDVAHMDEKFIKERPTFDQQYRTMPLTDQMPMRMNPMSYRQRDMNMENSVGAMRPGDTPLDFYKEKLARAPLLFEQRNEINRALANMMLAVNAGHLGNIYGPAVFKKALLHSLALGRMQLPPGPIGLDNLEAMAAVNANNPLPAMGDNLGDEILDDGFGDYVADLFGIPEVGDAEPPEQVQPEYI